MPQHGKHTFFLLNGCRDTSDLGFAADRPWDLTVRVTTDTSTATYIIDRFD